MGNLKLLGFPNLFSLGAANVICGSEASASMADDNLESEEPSEFWRSTSNSPDKSWICGTLDGFSLSGGGLVGTNITAETAQIRFVVATTAGTLYTNGWEVIVPTAIEASGSSGYSGVVGSIDNGFTPGSDWVTPSTPNVGMTLRLSFPTPGATPRTGPNYQGFWIYAKNTSGTTLSPTTAPQIQLFLAESGSGIRQLCLKRIVSGTGQWIYCPWDADELGTPDGSVAEVIVSTSGVSTYDIHIGEVVWQCEQANISGAAAGDSGWLTYTSSSNPDGSIVLAPESFLYSTFIHDFGSLKSGSELWVFIREDWSPDYVDTGANFAEYSVNLPPFGYIEAGVLVGGETFSPEVNFSYGEFFGVEDLSSQQLTDGGQEFGSRRVTRRLARIPLELLSTEEAHFLMDRWVRRKGVLSPVLVSLIPDEDDFEEVATTFYATLRRVENWMGASPAEGAGRNLVLEIEERF